MYDIIYKGVQAIVYISSIKSTVILRWIFCYTWNMGRKKKKTYRWNRNNWV